MYGVQNNGLKAGISILKVIITSRAPGLTSGLQGSVNVHRGALLLVPQWQCISSFVIYIWTLRYWLNTKSSRSSEKHLLAVCAMAQHHNGPLQNNPILR